MTRPVLDEDEAEQCASEECDITLLVDLINEGRNVVFDDVKRCTESKFAVVPAIIKNKFEELLAKKKRGRATSLKSESLKRAFPDDFPLTMFYVRRYRVLESHGFDEFDIHTCLARYYDEKTLYTALRYLGKIQDTSVGKRQETVLNTMCDIYYVVFKTRISMWSMLDRLNKRKKNDRDRKTALTKISRNPKEVDF